MNKYLDDDMEKYVKSKKKQKKRKKRKLEQSDYSPEMMFLMKH